MRTPIWLLPFMCSACGAYEGIAPADADESVTAHADHLFRAAQDEFTKWPCGGGNFLSSVGCVFDPPQAPTRIRVCFAQAYRDSCNATTNCNFEKRKDVVRTVLSHSWDSYTNVEFYDFGLCLDGVGPVETTPNDNPEGALVFRPWPGSGGGACGFGYKADGHNTVCGLTHAGEEAGELTPELSYTYWSAVVLHEVGHALGFNHEQNRGDNFEADGRPYWCIEGANRDAADPGTPDVYLTPEYDHWSQMNYCAANLYTYFYGPAAAYFSGFASYGDVTGAQAYYGKSAEGVWADTAPAALHTLKL